MQKPYNTLIESFIENKVGVADAFITDNLAASIRLTIAKLQLSNQLHYASTGNKQTDNVNGLVRGDSIYWLDRAHSDIIENLFLDAIDSFIKHLNATCYTGITGYEFHYAVYREGTFYKKHFDQFRNSDKRKYSLILYLNKDWQQDNGGELCIYHENSIQLISPESGKAVFFKSDELLHEVLPTTVPRLSIAGWLKVD